MTKTCPNCFVYPDVENDPGNQYYGKDGCALPCRLPVWTPDEWNQFEILVKVISLISFGFSLLAILASYSYSSHHRRIKKVHRLSHSFVTLSVAMSCCLFVFTFFSFDQKFCRNNTNAVKANAVIPFNLCEAETFVYNYFTIAFTLCWSVRSVLLCSKVVFRRDFDHYSYRFIFLIFLFPLIPSLYNIIMKKSTFVQIFPICLVDIHYVSEGVKDGFYTLILPIMVCGLISFVATMIIVIYAVYKFSSSKRINRLTEKFIISTRNLFTSIAMIPRNGRVCDSNPEEFNEDLMYTQSTRRAIPIRRQIYLLGPVVLCLLLYLIVYVLFIYGIVTVKFKYEDMMSDLDKWARCIFDKYDNDENIEPERACGFRPAFHLSVYMWLIICFVCLGGQPILFTVTYLPLYGYLKRQFRGLVQLVRRAYQYCWGNRMPQSAVHESLPVKMADVAREKKFIQASSVILRDVRKAKSTRKAKVAPCRIEISIGLSPHMIDSNNLFSQDSDRAVCSMGKGKVRRLQSMDCVIIGERKSSNHSECKRSESISAEQRELKEAEINFIRHNNKNIIEYNPSVAKSDRMV